MKISGLLVFCRNEDILRNSVSDWSSMIEWENAKDDNFLPMILTVQCEAPEKVLDDITLILKRSYSLDVWVVDALVNQVPFPASAPSPRFHMEENVQTNLIGKGQEKTSDNFHSDDSNMGSSCCRNMG